MDDLIARLKAARTHWVGGRPSLSVRIAFDRLLRENADEIIAALEECERMRAVVEAARATELREPDMRQGYWPHNWPEMQALRAALDELEGKS